MSIERSVQLPYSREQLFSLVSDISQYPQFLPYCQEAKVLRQHENRIDGTLRVGYKGLGYTFSTSNTNHPPEKIHMQLLSGPFNRLEGNWHFETLSNGDCRVHLHLEIIFKHALLGVMFKQKINEITNMMMAAFVQRAKDIYG